MNPSTVVIFVLYLAALLVIGLVIGRRRIRTPTDYFLAGRKVGPVALFFTLAATNFSAFFFFGFAGASFKIGYGYYGIMAVGTSLMALSFFYIGRRVWRAGKRFGLITPPELFSVRYGSPLVRYVTLCAFVLFTIPYIATQITGGGIALESLTDKAVPYELGAILVTFVISAYLMVGGMRSDVMTDVLQGAVMFVAALAGLGFVASGLGGFQRANEAALANAPELFSFPGGGGFITLQIWFSYLVLWMMCDPLFPHIFQRFYIARSEKALRFSMVAYPVITMVLFAFPVMLGVWGHAGTGFSGAPDGILPFMVKENSPSLLYGLVMAGGFAALMSTADSQLLVLSSMLTRDLCKTLFKGKVVSGRELKLGRLFVLVIAGIGLVIALLDLGSIFDILTKTTFTGLAILFPATIAALYWKRSTTWGVASSILVGEGFYLATFFLQEKGIMDGSWTFGFLPAIPVVLLSTAVLISVSFLTRPPEKKRVDQFFKAVER